MTVGSLFAGIGGLEYGLEMTGGFKTIWQVEIDEWCRKVLTKHWPDVPKYGDIRAIEELPYVDLICGGFPCQPVSLAGKRRAQADERWLWPDFLRIIRMVRPRYVIVENTTGLLSAGFTDVLSDLAEGGYDAEWRVLRASDVGAPHERGRVFLVAYPNALNGPAGVGHQSFGTPEIFRCGSEERNGVWLQAPPVDYRMDDGVPGRLYELRVGALGNAVVPQCGQYVGQMILDAERRASTISISR